LQRTRWSVRGEDTDRGEYHVGPFRSNTIVFAGLGLAMGAPGRRVLLEQEEVDNDASLVWHVGGSAAYGTSRRGVAKRGPLPRRRSRRGDRSRERRHNLRGHGVGWRLAQR